MGADIVGWRLCELQRGLGPDGFRGRMKLVAYRAAIERQLPPEAREQAEITVEVTGRPPRQLRYRQIVEEGEQFLAGSPECKDCPIAGGQPLGCYRYVTYPIDAVAEELLFAFFTQPSQVETKDSISDQLYRTVISNIPSAGTNWHKRGGRGGLAARPEPLDHAWSGFFSKRKVDSAQLLQALFISLDSEELVVAYTLFWTEFGKFAEERGVGPSTSRSLAELLAVGRLLLLVFSIADKGARVVIDS